MGMAKKHKKLPIELIFIVAVVIAIVLVLYLSQKAGSKSVASVNGQAITTDDLDYLLSTVPEQQRQSLTKENLTEIAINKELIRQEIVKHGIKVSEQEVNSLIERFLAQNNLTMQDYEKLLSQQGADINLIKQVYAEQLSTYKLMNETILKDLKVSEDETKGFYDTYKAQINNTYENSKEEIKQVILSQKAQQSFLLYIQQLRSSAEIKYL